MAFTDRTLTCKDCGSDFTFTASEQEFYAEKGFQNEPKRCPSCRSAQRAGRGDRRPAKMHDVVCASCGKQTQVPFEPTKGRPVYCRDCFDSQRQ